jgi:DNA helicase-2/ATP-dependent DNA helicase PcrA
MADILADLNDAQLRAVQHDTGPLLVLAGAGSGKTRMLTHRIAYLIEERGVAPEHIIGVTFTNKAAGEMLERLKYLQTADRLPYVGTFHGLCVRILRESGDAVAVPSNFTIFDSSDQLAAIKQAMAQAGIDEKTAAPRALLGLISSAKNELIDASGYARLAATPLQRRAAEVYPHYQQILADAGGLDFDDLLMQAVRLLKTDRTAAGKWAERCQYLLVDEYQDTNTAQYVLIKLLAARHGNVCVVGDDWQSIYSWRGADFRNILNFERDWPKTTVIKLEQNYRSTENILDAAHRVIAKNQQRSDKKLWTKAGGGAPVRLLPVANEHQEADAIVGAIKAALELKLRGHGDFAVLYRTNAQSRVLEDAFVRYGVPYRIVGGMRFYERREIKDMLAYLRFLFQPRDRVAFERLLNAPPRGIGPVSLERLKAAAGTDSYSAVLADPARHVPRLPAKAATSLIKLAGLLSRLDAQLASGGLLSQALSDLVRGIGYLDYLEDGTLRGEERAENVRELISVAREYDAVGLGGFLEEVALVSDIDEWDARSQAVTLMTVHAAKGLEFPVVFMAGMEEGIFPHSRALYEPDEMEEERRLCYVGMTRAKQELVLSYARQRLLYGSIQHGPPSRFLADIGDGATLSPATQPAELTRQPVSLDLTVGDTVSHPVFGDGVIRELEGETATVIFKGKAVKRLNLSFAPLARRA